MFRCRGMSSHSTLPKSPERFSHRPELGKATALGFGGVSTVLSSVLPPVLSCSLTSEYKQESFPRANTTRRKWEYSFTGQRAIIGAFKKKKSFLDFKLGNGGIYLDGLWHNHQILPDMVKHNKICINKAIVKSRNFKFFFLFWGHLTSKW